MGIFSDKCQALVDPNTGKALSGAALEAARQDPEAEHCGNRVRKAGRFCNVCGSPAPRGWWRCHSCGKWIGNEAQFCSHCNARQHPEERADMAGGVWARSPGAFAQRFEIGDIKRLLKHRVQIQEGTAAIVLDGGAVKDVMAPGEHNPDSLLRRINHWGDPPPRSAILVDSADFVLPLRVEGLRSAERFPIEFYGEIILRFRQDKKSGQALVGNLLKDARHFAYGDIAAALTGGSRHAVDAQTATTTVDDLVRDPERRRHVENALQQYVGDQLGRLGLELVAVSSAEFSGQEYEELAEKAGQVEATKRRMAFDREMRDIQSSDRMHEFKTDADLKEYVTQRAHEAKVSDRHREVELDRLSRLWRHEREVEENRGQREEERKKVLHDRDMAEVRDDYERGKRVEDAKVGAAVSGIQAQQDRENARLDHEEATEALKLRELKNREKARYAKELAEIRNGMSRMELFATVEDPVQREDLMKLFEMEMKEGKSPGQILAMAADKSPAAAQALQQMADQERRGNADYVQKMQEMYRDAMDRHERTLKTYMEPANRAATDRGDSVHIDARG